MTLRQEFRFIKNTVGTDSQPLVIMRNNISGGMETRHHETQIAENQTTVLYNVDISVPGKSVRRPGVTLIEDLSDNAGVGLFGYEPNGGTNQLVAVHGQKLETWSGSGSFTEQKTNFTNNLDTIIIKAQESGEGDVFLAGNGTDNWFRFEPDDLSTPQDLGSTDNAGSDSPPASTVGLYYRNRLWVLKEIDGRAWNLWFSSAYPSDYSTAFDTRSTGNGFRIPCGASRALIGTRDIGILVFGADSIWALNPSIVPDATEDKPEKVLDIGCISNKTVCQVGDDVYFLAQDGVRGVFRTAQDKLQIGQSFPLSYALKDEYENISWGYISKACAVQFDNKYLIALPVNSTYNNHVWVYYPALNAWMVITGWNVSGWATMIVSGERRLYAIDSTDGKVYRAWYGDTDNGTVINYQEEGRSEDMGQPYIKKAGGEVLVKCASTDDTNLTVSASFDFSDYNTLGVLNLAGELISFPVTFPVTFVPSNIASKKFHLDEYGEWYHIKLKLQHNVTSSDAEVEVLERSITSYPTEYISEEEV